MLGKLALRNAKRSFKDYLIYMITVTLAFALVFSFNAAIFSDEINDLSQSMNSFKMMVIFVSVIVVFIIGWLIHYTMRFMLEKRSKEFGTYAVLGINNKKIANLFFLENVILGFISLVLAFLLGIFLYQIIVAIIMNIFNMPYKITVDISLEAVLLTLLYFVLIFLFSLLRNRRKLKKMKIYDLLYMEKKNENTLLKSRRNRTIICILSLILGIISIVLLFSSFKIGVDPNMGMILLALVLMVVCIYGFYLSASSLIAEIFLANKKIKYHKHNLFLMRNFSSKINTMGMTLGTLGLLFCFTFISMGLGLFMKDMFDEQMDDSAPYDISVYYPADDDDFSDIIDFVSADYTIEAMMNYKTYFSDLSYFTDHLDDGYLGYQEKDGFLALSDYNKLREMRGLNKVNLDKNKYLIHTSKSLKYSLTKLANNYDIDINGQKLTNQGVLTKGFTTAWAPGCPFVIVVNDEYVKDMVSSNSILNINTKEETAEDYYEKLTGFSTPSLYTDDDVIYSVANVTVRGKMLADNKSWLITISFSLFYLAFIFTMTAATILSIRQLSDGTRYKFRYQILSKLGMSKGEIDKVIFKQLVLYFLFPVILPVILSTSAALAVFQIFVPVVDNDNMIWESILITFGLFFFLYIIYFVATLIQFRKSVHA